MTFKGNITFGLVSLSLLGLAALPSQAQVTTIAPGVLEYGDEDQGGAGPYSGGFNPVGFDPKTGAVLSGLAPGAFTQGAQSGGHDEFKTRPTAGDFAGTDTIHVGSTFTTLAHDGYAGQYLNGIAGVKGPDTFALDYSSLLPAGSTLQTLTLGIAADDFQHPEYGQPFTASINGVVNTALSNKLNNLTLTDPSDLFFTFGVDPALLTSSNILNLSIDEGGDGGDGYAVDFLTVGVTSSPVPEASTTASFGLLLALGLGGLVVAAKRKKTNVKASA